MTLATKSVSSRRRWMPLRRYGVVFRERFARETILPVASC
jgi:hypothetical protein